jgi:hypothetical protein
VQRLVAAIGDKMKFNHDWGLLVDRVAEAGECVKCGACEEVCTQHLDIMARLEEIEAWEKQLKA